MEEEKEKKSENSNVGWETALPDEKQHYWMEKTDDCFWKLGCEEKWQKPPTSTSHNFFNSTPNLMFISPKLSNFLSSTQWVYPI